MTSRRRHLLLALLVAGAIAGPAAGSAGAETICVHAPASTPGCTSVEQDLQTALDDAQAQHGDDTILLGNAGFLEQGPFEYPRLPALVLDRVTVKGVGPGRPVLTAAPGAEVIAASTITLDGIDIQLPGTGDGVGAHVVKATLHDVTVRGPGPAASGAQGIRSEGDLTLDDVRVNGTGDVGVSVALGTTHASRVRTSNVSDGVTVGDNANLQATGSRFAGTRFGVFTRGGTSLSASVLETSAADAVGLLGGDSAIALDHVSVVHRGAVNGTDAALDFHPVDFGGSAHMSSVVLAGYTRGIRRDTSEGDFPFPITIRDSVWDNAHDVFVNAPNSGGVSELGDAHVDPKLVDVASGDFRLRGTSAAVDRDSQTAGGYADVDGRAAIGQADAGAIEYQRRAPLIDATNVPGAGATGEALSFAAAASDPDGDALQFAWDFGDGGVAAGSQVQHAFAAAGLHSVTLHVTDEAGAQTTRTFSVAVTGDKATTGSSGGDTSSTGGAKDAIAPKLSKVRLSKDHRKVLFTVSERAKVRITVRGHKIVKTVAAGRRSIRLGRVLRARAVLKLTATDAAGNRSSVRTLQVRS
jgi:PKD domain